jgi:sialidase-1
MHDPLDPTDVFVGGTDGVHTYRIPSLVTAPDGSLLALCEARKVSTGDATPTDMVAKRSMDGGRTWLPMQRVLAGVDAEAIMNPCPVVDGPVVRLVCINAHKTDRGRHRQVLMCSHDSGRNWSPPVDLTDAIRDGDDTFVPGPGVSIATRSGRLVVPGYTNAYAADRTRTASHSRAMVSDDHGATWRLGRHVDYAMSNESQVVELHDGALLLNFRIQKSDGDHPGCRGSAVSRDGGATWAPSVLVPALNEAPCQAGFIRWPAGDRESRDRLVFSNPDARPGPDGGARTRMTVRISGDGGRTWPVARLVYAGPSVYSCPTVLPDGDIGLLYECGLTSRYERIRFARLPQGWLTAAAR